MGIPANGISAVTLNGETVWKNGKTIKAGIIYQDSDNRYIKIVKGGGEWKLEGHK